MLKEMIEEKISERYKERRQKKNFYPTDSDKCPKRLFLEFKGVVGDGLTINNMKTFEIGNYTHRYLQELLGGISEFRIDTTWRGHKLTGYADDLIVLDGLTVVDYKTVSTFGVKHIIKRPKEEHIKQINLYMDVLKIQRGILLYWDKNDGTMIEHEVRLDKNVLDEIDRFFSFVEESLKTNTVPDNMYKLGNYKCKYCPYKSVCKKIKVWKDEMPILPDDNEKV